MGLAFLIYCILAKDILPRLKREKIFLTHFTKLILSTLRLKIANMNLSLVENSRQQEMITFQRRCYSL